MAGGGNTYNQAAQAQTGALQGTAAAATPNFGAFQNPYENQVVQQTLTDLGGAQQQAMNQIGAQATAAGAFGGSRHGVAEAETNKAFADQAARTTSGLRHQGYQNGIQNALATAGHQLNAAGQLGNLAGQSFGFGQSINNQQMQQGLLQQGMMQQLIDAAKTQFSGYAGSPGQSLQYPLAAIGGSPQPSSQTTSKDPGLFNYLSLGLGLL